MVIFCTKFAQQIRFWWVLGKIKPRNNEKTQKMRKKPFFGGSILELKIGQNDEMLSRVHPSTSTSGTGLGAIRSVKMGQDHRTLPFSKYFGVLS